MASAQNRKRAHADDLSQELRPSKKIKSRERLHGLPNFPPEFWDNLSRVPLTRRALRELDRRKRAPGPAAPAVHTNDLARFARQGGPDLRHLRGYADLKGAARAMASRQSAASSSRRTKSTKSTKASGASSSTKATSAYDDAFEQHAIDNGIYPDGYEHPDGRQTPEPANIDEIRLELAAARASLSPSQFSDSAFRNFKKKNKTASEGTVKRNVIPIIAGNSDIPNDGELLFTNIDSMTGGATVKAMPDFFDGARPGDIHSKIRDENEEGNLNKLIIPTRHASAPVAPNFFLEVKAPKGGSDVALRQALHNGAIGTRAMHALKNYGAEEPTFDGNAYTYSSTYHGGHLQLYAHHVTPPTAPDGRPEYHMTQLKGFSMLSDRDAFVQGATAFRNARDSAKRYRDGFIQSANASARQTDAEAPPEAETPGAMTEQYEESTTDEFVDCEDHVESQIIGTANYAVSLEVGEGPALPDYPNEEEEEPSQQSTSLGAGAPAISFATSFTSSIAVQLESQTTGSSKRNRASHSPPSHAQPRKKHNSVK